MSRSLILALKIGVSLLFIVVLLTQLDRQELWQTAREIDLFFFVLSVAFAFLMVAVSCWKWWLILRYQGHPVSFPQLYSWYFVGYFYSNFLPSNVGGDVVRTWLVSRRTGSGSVALISVFAERLSGILVLLVFAVLLPFMSREGAWREPAVWVIMLMAGTLLLGLLCTIAGGRAVARSPVAQRWCTGFQQLVRADRPGRSRRCWEFVARRGAQLDVKADQLIQVLRARPAALWALTGLTVLFYVMTLLNVVLAYRTFGVWPDVIGIASMLPVALLVAMIPITLGNLGIAEGAYVYFFGLAGMPGELTLAMGLFLRIKVWLLGSVGLWFHMREPSRLRPDEAIGAKRIHG